MTRPLIRAACWVWAIALAAAAAILIGAPRG